MPIEVASEECWSECWNCTLLFFSLDRPLVLLGDVLRNYYVEHQGDGIQPGLDLRSAPYHEPASISPHFVVQRAVPPLIVFVVSREVSFKFLWLFALVLRAIDRR